MTTKTCTRCHHDKPLEDYNRMAASRDGRRAQCTACTREANNERRLRNIDEYRERDRRRYRLGCKEPDGVGACNYPGCRRTAATEGLCATHHHEVTKGDESPLVLVGEPVRGPGGVWRWVA